MSDGLDFASRDFPARIADLGFSVRLPRDWITHELPDEELDFSNPTRFVPLAVVTAPHAAIVVVFAARPAYDDGTLHDWAHYLLGESGLTPRAVGAHTVAGVPAVVGEATQESELGPMIVRFAFLEDGGRLVNLTFTTPELLDSAVRAVWFTVLESFALADPRSATGAAHRDAMRQGDTEEVQDVEGAVDVGNAVDFRSAEDAEDAEAEHPRALLVFDDVLEDEVAEVDDEQEGPSAGMADYPVDEPAPAIGDFALADDTASLEREHPINASLRDGGVGLVPNVSSRSDRERRATVAVAALDAELDVPYGWHVVDDGRRTLLFEPEGEVQINFDFLTREGRDDDALLDALEAEARASYAAPDFARLDDGDVFGVGVHDIHDGEQPLEQFHLLRRGYDAPRELRARVTATPARSEQAVKLAKLVLESAVFLSGATWPQEERPVPPPTSAYQPQSDAPHAWWLRALALEGENRLDEAERTITAAIDHQGRALAVADLYAHRMKRLRATGDEDGATEAFRKAEQWSFFYASQATSGGEGAALSLARDEFRAELVSDFGRDPDEPE